MNLLRGMGKRIATMFAATSQFPIHTTAVAAASHGPVESESQFNERYVQYLSRNDIDGWEIRKTMNDLLGMDIIIDPSVAEAGLRACRQANDIALAIRWMEGVKEKCGDDAATIYPYILKSLRSTLTELGVPTVEELGYDKPELALKSVYDM